MLNGLKVSPLRHPARFAWFRPAAACTGRREARGVDAIGLIDSGMLGVRFLDGEQLTGARDAIRTILLRPTKQAPTVRLLATTPRASRRPVHAAAGHDHRRDFRLRLNTTLSAGRSKHRHQNRHVMTIPSPQLDKAARLPRWSPASRARTHPLHPIIQQQLHQAKALSAKNLAVVRRITADRFPQPAAKLELMHCSKERSQRLSDDAVIPKKMCACYVTSKSRQPNSRLTPAGVNPPTPLLTLESDRRKEVTLALSSADPSPLYGFILLPGTISSGFAMKRFSIASSQTKPALFIALE